ncbi:ATP-binding protein [Rivularia sp. UHCC 0363]|uniref:sensor histidine kinase n=1 Tax=Rivularia sp. UHCC 0363 TaxID=3110244 RepID=UPI002B1EC2B0|nr:ATP-binding protein [Rivularia sp. UHCC 0363]MEA5597456.1 ATP-binding protein [Rivularia sp. UHCC 0363]
MTDAREPFQGVLRLVPTSPLAPAQPAVRPAAQVRLRNLKVNQKIALSYAFSLGLAVMGTLSGFLIGNYFHQKASAPQQELAQELELLNQLQISLLKIRTHQIEFVALLGQPADLQAEYREFLQHHASFQQAWNQLRRTKSLDTSPDLAATQRLLLRQTRSLDEYVGQISALLLPAQTADAQLSAQKIQQIRSQLIGAKDRSMTLQLEAFSSQLVPLIAQVQQKHAQATAAVIRTDAFRNQIVALSMLVSVLAAAILSTWLSRAIVHPLRTTTQVAQQVTQDSNFELQAPVTTTDEVGILAEALNQLIRRVKTLLAEQQAATAQTLIQSEKMSSLGQMLAGVAHEINNPITYIYGNLAPVTEYIDGLLDLIHAYETLPAAPADQATIQAKITEIDLEFIEEDLPRLLQSMRLGAERTRQMVLSLRSFSRIDEQEAQAVDLHDCIDSTLLLLNNRIKNGVQIDREYGELPTIEGYAGSLYQVFMNLLSNALDALDERVTLWDQDSTLKAEDQPQITIATRFLASQPASSVQVKIADNGAGIDPTHLSKIFDTYFTTKPIGVGTGLGLAISREIIFSKHHGEMHCQSQVGQGTEFTITLPIKQPQPAASDSSATSSQSAKTGA